MIAPTPIALDFRLQNKVHHLRKGLERIGPITAIACFFPIVLPFLVPCAPWYALQRRKVLNHHAIRAWLAANPHVDYHWLASQPTIEGGIARIKVSKYRALAPLIPMAVLPPMLLLIHYLDNLN